MLLGNCSASFSVFCYNNNVYGKVCVRFGGCVVRGGLKQ